MSLAAGSKLGPYEILALIGAGGMGEVYKARDTRLGRLVAIKVSKEQFSERFDREARAIAALNHPHVCQLYDIGANYLVMEFVEGAPIAPVDDLEKLIDLAVQIAEGLESAHGRGIVHRDLKPANILVTRDGQVKILDFGLALIASPARGTSLSPQEEATETLSLTGRGTTVGTVAYMSPEQARGETVDARTDLWSFGVVLYEMAAGARPFQGPTAPVVFEALLSKAPVPVRERNPKIPQELERIIGKLLEKDRDLRYQSAADLRTDLKRVKHDGGSTATVAPAVPRSRARMYGIAATAALILVTGGALLWQRLPAKPLTDQDVLVLSDFANTTDDHEFDGTLRQALAIQLEQSPFLRIMDDEQVREDLGLMGRPAGERITNDIAHEICARENEKATIGGSIASLGKAYAITLQATDCHSGRTLAREQSQAEDKEHVLGAVSAAATGMRTKLGESLSTVQKLNRPLDQVTTASLPAFQAYSLGREQMNQGLWRTAIPFFKHATELDPNFAIAYEWTSIAYEHTGEANREKELRSKAFGLIDRVSEEERLFISEEYYARVTGNLDKAAEICQLFVRTYPRDARAHGNLANIYVFRGEFEKALPEYQTSNRSEPRAAGYNNLVMILGKLNRLDEAKAVAQEAFARGIDTANIHLWLLNIAYMQGDHAVQERESEWFSGKPEEYQGLGTQAQNVAFRLGQFRKGKELFLRAAESARLSHSNYAAQYQGQAALLDVTAEHTVLDRCRIVRDIGLAAASLCFTPVEAGQANEKAMVEYVKQRPDDTILNAVFLPGARAEIALLLGQPAKAIELLESAKPYDREYDQAVFTRGLAYLSMGKGAEAAAEFQRLLGGNYGNLPLCYLGIAKAAVITGDTAKAKKAYEDFFTLWKDADPDRWVLVEARKQYSALR